jgi:DNA (cytosine-5)-methyltransferase 1
MKNNYNILEDTNRILLDASNFGVPQERKRVIIIGVRKDLKTDFTIEDIYNDLEEISKKQPKTTVLDAISDLPKLKAGQGKEILKHSPTITNDYLKLLRHPDQTTIHHHIARNHNDLDIERYKHMSKNIWTLAELYSNIPDLIHPKKRLFNNSYVVQRYDMPSKTIIAHLYKDGNQFIHPDFTQQRTFTPREAARIQSFPDNFIFPCSKTQQYKQIGNAVPPLLAKHIAKLLKKYLEKMEK